MLKAASYDHQLKWLHGLLLCKPDREQTFLILSIAQSVKDARKCNLDHRPDPHVK